MGIAVEFNPDLALRDYSHYKSGKRKKEECLPLKLEKGKIYNFLKSGQRNYWLEGELPLLETKGNQKLSRPFASIKILETIHFLYNNQPYTKGKYKVIEIFDIDSPKINFESYKRIK
ncbi:MAG: hypothetical protein NTY30_02850 [Candidatus Berkelbacteria bacterium]|nr:hypothetical protein [Candidatus Berkelbacteria bacterium]